MDTTKKLILIFILLLSFQLITVSCSSDYDEKLKNCKQIKKGMSEGEVVEIMGKPVERSKNKLIGGNKYYILYYGTPAMASTGIDIYFDQNTQKVTKAICGE